MRKSLMERRAYGPVLSFLKANSRSWNEFGMSRSDVRRRGKILLFCEIASRSGDRPSCCNAPMIRRSPTDRVRATRTHCALLSASVLGLITLVPGCGHPSETKTASTSHTPVTAVQAPAASLASPSSTPAPVASGSTATSPGSTAPAATLSFNDHIQPILSENCYACHGPDSATREGKLRLDRFEDATMARGDHEPAIVPGRPDVSPVIERILSDDPDERMPPANAHKSLKPTEIALLRQWIAEGAVYQPHWSLIAPQRPAVPAAGRNWARNPIDAFVAATHAQQRLTAAPEETPARLLRRVTFDLTGLPPTPESLAAFTANPSASAYEKEVDRLLASDASAEHFARHWLDAVRYADTHGIHIDNYRSIWPYRDWVVDAYRRNLPYDQFTVEQIAGDLLPGATLDQKVATGFNRCLPTTSEGGAIPAEYEAIYAKDRVETVSTVWLGLTTSCAACHDHKFDPISTREFYSLTAFFRDNTMPAMDGNVAETEPSLFVPAAADRTRWEELEAELAKTKSALQQRRAAGEADFARWLATATHLPLPPVDHTVLLHRPLLGKATAAGAEPAPDHIAGPFGPAPSLSAAAQVLGPPLPLRRDGQFAFSLMIRVTEKPSGSVVSSRGSEASAPGWEVFLDQGRPGLWVSEGGSTTPIRSVGKLPLTPGSWHHLMLLFDGSGSRNRLIDVWIDGKDVANQGVPRAFRTDIEPPAPLRLGSAPESTSGLTGGTVHVQDLRQFDRGFAGPEIKALAEGVSAFESLSPGSTERTPAQLERLRLAYFAGADAPSLQLAALRDGLQAEARVLRRRGGVTLVMEEKKDSAPFAHVLVRGEYSQLGERVPAATPAVLPALPAGEPANRLTLARWLFTPDHPLTARVTVNRVWQQLFGTGLVESSGDFGITGSRPSHPALLDWLAVEFRESGWDHRRLVRLLVTSATYRQSAAVSPALLERDPANRLLARGPRHRLDAEVLRDQALAASGLLVDRRGGPPVRPYQPEGIWEDVAMKESTTRFYRQDRGEALYRRSLYTFWKRTAPPPAMDILNAPSREVSCVRRDRTNTPLQALVTLNDPAFVEAARQLAAQALGRRTTFDARLDHVSLRLLGRTLAADERAVVKTLVDDALAVYQRTPAKAAELLAIGESAADPKLPAVELAAWTLAASQVMNLDESLTK